MRVTFFAVTCLGLTACGDRALIPEKAIVADSIPVPLAALPGDAGNGLQVFTERTGGHCVLCHQVSGLDTPFQGNLGPDLSFVGDRLQPGQLRLRIVDYQRIKPGAVMPSYYRVEGLYQVEETYRGTPILTAQEVEDLVSYLTTLGETDA
ncbi:MAG: hypothetical protein Hens3KO_08780 [Henriciella sp.]